MSGTYNEGRIFSKLFKEEKDFIINKLKKYVMRSPPGFAGFSVGARDMGEVSPGREEELKYVISENRASSDD